MPPPRATAVLSQAGRAGPDEPIRAIPAGPAGCTCRPPAGCTRQTSEVVRRQTASSLNAPALGGDIRIIAEYAVKTVNFRIGLREWRICNLWLTIPYQFS